MSVFLTCHSAVFLRVYCPAGCKNVTGDVWGNSEQGYRDVSKPHFIWPNWIRLFFCFYLWAHVIKVLHVSPLLLQTSVLCKSAIHAGAASDSLGGRVTVNRGRSLTLYESTFANGILSKMCVCCYCTQIQFIFYFMQMHWPFNFHLLTGDHYLKRSCSSAKVRHDSYHFMLEFSKAYIMGHILYSW